MITNDNAIVVEVWIRVIAFTIILIASVYTAKRVWKGPRFVSNGIVFVCITLITGIGSDIIFWYLNQNNKLGWLIVLIVSVSTWLDLIVYWTFIFKYWLTSR